MKLSLLAFGILTLAISVHAHRTSDIYALLPDADQGKKYYVAATANLTPKQYEFESGVNGSVTSSPTCQLATELNAATTVIING
jgi:hypothetical protein